MRLLDSLRRPEYTGPNRCWPCTVVNAAILLVVSVLVAIPAPMVGLLVLVVGAVAIGLRGYVIPYTPQFAPRIVAVVPGADRVFPAHAAERNAGGIGDEDADGDAIVAALVDAAVLTGDEELGIDDAVAQAWNDEMRAIADHSTIELADAVAEASPNPVRTKTYERAGKEWIIVTDEDGSIQSETWLSRAVAITDVAAVRTLTDHGIDRQTAANAASPLRLFLTDCPDCGGELIETTTETCCGGPGPGGPVNVLACRDCTQRLATFD